METYDLIVGIPSYNEADSITFVVEQVDKGLQEYFPDLKCQIVNVDNNSPDGTKDVFLKVETKTDKLYITTLEGVKGKGNNFYNLFKHAQKVKAKAVVVVDADLLSITPEWVKNLGEPIIKGKDFISPVYIRHKYDGTITNNLVFPLIFALFNKYVRQPIGGDFAVSGKLVNYYLKQEWKESTKQYGIDNFMTMNALIGGFETDQVLLGAKIHKPSAPKLGPMFIQVVNTLFSLITNNKDKFKGGKEKPVVDFKLPDVNPPDMDIDVDKILKSSTDGYAETKDFLQKNLEPEIFKKIEEVFSKEKLYIDADLWSDIVFDFLRIYPLIEDKLQVVEAFKPLYFGRAYSFISTTQDLSSLEAEKIFLEQAEAFWEKKDKFLG